MSTVQSFTITFQTPDAAAGDGGYIKFENDGEKTTFYPGDTVPYRMYLVGVLQSHVATSGIITPAGTGNRAVADEYQTFSGDSATLAYPVTGTPSLSWVGTIYDEDFNPIASPPLPTIQADRVTLTMDQTIYGIIKASYSAGYTRYQLSGVPTDIHTAIIWAGASA